MDFLLEGQDGMCDVYQVQWTIIPLTAPQPWIACSRCGGLKPFRSSGKIRLNANGKKLDAWLIYKCTTCDKTWNRPIFERRISRELDPAIFDALHSNRQEWIRTQAFDIQALRRHAHQIDEFADVEIRKSSALPVRSGWNILEIELIVPLPTNLRLDRLLATELGISRTSLLTLHKDKRLWIDPRHPDMLRRRIKHGSRINIDHSATLELHAAFEIVEGVPRKVD